MFFFCAFWDKFALHLVKSLLNNFKTGVGTASSNGASWDECREQHQHQSNKKALYSMPNLYFFGANKVKFNAFFCWDNPL